MRALPIAGLLLTALPSVGFAQGDSHPTDDVPMRDAGSPAAVVAAAPTDACESPRAQHAHAFLADPFLLVGAIGFGAETADRGSANAPGNVVPTAPLDFHVSAAALWSGLVGPAIGLYSSAGSGIQVGSTGARPNQGFGDRVSFVGAVALRPLAFVAWSRGDDYLGRLAGGVGLELGVSAELARTSLDSAVAPGFHALLSVDVPLVGGGSTGGLALRASARLLVSPDQQLAKDATTGVPQVVEPGTVLQLFGGLAYSL